MANSKAISIRVPDELLKKIDRLAEEKYKSHKGTPNRSLVVLDAIAAYFDTMSDTSIVDESITVSNSVNIVEFNELRDIMITLSDTIRQLEDRLLTLSDNVNKLDANVESRSTSENSSTLSDVTVSDSVDDAPDTKPDSIEIAAVLETEPEAKLLTLNMEALAKRLKTTEKTLRAKRASDESWREFMKSRPDPESIQWARPVKVGKAWQIVSI